MTQEFVKLVAELHMVIADWQSRTIPNEKEFIGEIRDLNKKISEELPKQELPEVEK